MKSAVAATAFFLFSAWPAYAHDGDDMPPADSATAFHTPIPILMVKSVEASIEHYTTVLSFHKNWDWPEEQENKTFASVSNGKATVFFSQTAEETQPIWVYYTVDDIDKLHEVYKAAEANISDPLSDKSWGMREFQVTDPDGHLLRIGAGLEHHEEGEEAKE